MSNQSPAEALRQQILNDVLIHELECQYSLFDRPCNCIQQTVADNIMPLVTACAATVEREAVIKARIEEAAKALESIKKPGYGNYDYTEMQEYERVFSILYARLAALDGVIGEPTHE